MKSDRSSRWFIRITAPWDHLKVKYSEVCSWIDYVRSGVGYHVGSKTGKPHCHILLELRTELQKQSIDTRLKKLFDVKGADYSSKVWDGCHKAVSYLYHDSLGEVDVKGLKLSEADIDEIDKLKTVYNEIVTTAKAKASFKCVDYILEKIAESKRYWAVEEIARAIFMGVYERQWHPPGPMMDRYVDEIRIRQYSKEDVGPCIDSMVSQYMSKYQRW